MAALDEAAITEALEIAHLYGYETMGTALRRYLQQDVSVDNACAVYGESRSGLNQANDLVERIGSLLLDEQTADMTFLVEGECLPAHRLIVSTSCKYFGYIKSNSRRSLIRILLRIVGSENLPQSNREKNVDRHQ